MEERRPPLPPRPPTDEKHPTSLYDPYPDNTSKHNQQDNQQQPHDSDITNDPPPPYTPQTLIQNQTTDHAYRPSTILPKPIVIPQTSHTVHGTIYRPFLRAYAPALESHGISKADFLAFIDALNDVWLANPYIQAIGATSALVGFIPLLEFQIARLGVQAAAEYGSIKVSQMRTQAYMRLANEELFRPRGLRVQVLRTRVMMGEVGIPGDVLDLGAVGRDEEFGDLGVDGEGKEQEKGGGGYDPQLRRMEALKEFVSPVVVEEEVVVAKDNWVKRATDAQEKWFAERQNQLLVGKREKAGKWLSEAEEAEREINGKIEEVQATREAARVRARERLQGPLGESLQGRGIVQDDLEKDLKKLDKSLNKLVKEREKRVTKVLQKGERRLQRVEKTESRIAQKVMWVVVTGDDGTGFQNHLWEDSESC